MLDVIWILLVVLVPADGTEPITYAQPYATRRQCMSMRAQVLEVTEKRRLAGHAVECIPVEITK